jgi:rRNA pseudouridine-1189 N-methylase Emg1 (Nep1/Mra1 family)
MVDNMQNIMDLYNQMQQNPIQMLSRKFNIPQNINNPNDIIQHLLNSGQVTQTQVNNAMQMANNPMFKKMFGR